VIVLWHIFQWLMVIVFVFVIFLVLCGIAAAVGHTQKEGDRWSRGK